VSGYLSDGGDRYAAHFEKSTGQEWAARHGLSADDYQSAFDSYAKQGFRLTWVSAYESGSQEHYAAIWEKKAGPAWAARHGLTSDQYQQAFNEYTKQGYRLVHVNGHSRNGSARFAAIFEKSAGPAWVAKHNLTAADYQKAFDDFSKQGYRVRLVSGYRPGDSDLYAAIWEKTSGPVWSARHGVPDSWYQNVFDNYYYQGYRPTYIAAFTSGSGARMNCIWENTNFKGSDLQFIASKVKEYLATYQAPGASIAITKDGRLVYAAGYGEANQSSGEEASATSLFRIASVSKPITSVAIMKLVEAKKLSLDDKVFGPGSILGSRYPTPSDNKKIEKVTVRHLLQHSSGFTNTPSDPMFQNTSYSHDELIKWVLNADDRKVTREPGSQYEYLNFGYCLLGRIIETKSGKSYEQYVKEAVLGPSGVTAMTIGQNSESSRKPREVTYYPSNAYNLNVTRFDAHGGWIASPIDLVRFMVRVDGEATKPDILASDSRTTMVTKAGIKDSNGNDPNYGFGWANNPQSHNGAMSGTVAILAKAQNGFTFAVIANTRPANDGFAGNMSAMAQNIINGISAWPSYDLF